jgi:hypothetical protein
MVNGYSLVMQQNKFKTMDARTTAANLIADYLTIVRDLNVATLCATHHAQGIEAEYDIDLDPGKHIFWKEVVKQIKTF